MRQAMHLRSILFQRSLCRTPCNDRTTCRIRRPKSSTASFDEPAAARAAASAEASAMSSFTPTHEQLRNVFLASAVPMMGFGFMDQTVMLQAGNIIDCTIGVTFGLSTLTAAAFGQVCSDAAGVLFGGTLESFAKRAGLPSANLTSAQRVLPVVKRVRLAGGLIGVVTGCFLGLINLLFIDTDRSSTLKLRALTDDHEFAFEVDASNAVRDDATVLTVRGPDVDGLLASMTTALTARGCSLLELKAHRLEQGVEICDQEGVVIEDVFVVVHRATKGQIPDEELDDLAQAVMEATRTPMNLNCYKAKMNDLESDNADLESDNAFLIDRLQKLERIVQGKHVTVVPSVDKIET